MAKWKRKRRNAIKWRSAQNLQKHNRTHMGKYRQQMDTHAAWAMGDGKGGQGTEDTGHWTLATCNARENLASGAPGKLESPGSQDLFLFACKQSSVQLRRLSLLASAGAASAERGLPSPATLAQPPTTPF